MRPALRPSHLQGVTSRLCHQCRNARRLESTIFTNTTRASHSTSRRSWSTLAPSALIASTSEKSRYYSTTSTAAAQEESSSPPTSAPETHYDLFPKSIPLGPPPKGPFAIDLTRLRNEYLRLQAAHHPDLHWQQQPGNPVTSTLINEAYRTLANPLTRAQYLLSLQGVNVAEDEKLKVEDPGLLMLVLEAREEIEDAAEESDLEAPRRANDERIAATEAALDKAFAAHDLDAAKTEAVRMRYWINIKESLDNWEKGKPIVLEH